MIQTHIKTFIASLALGLTIFIFAPHVTNAATIEVNSKGDLAADDGECTLREAIISAGYNFASGAFANECVAGDPSPTRDIIEFNISGAADFTRNGQDGYTIELFDGLPGLDETMTIDGYSQAGALFNADPRQARVLIEIDGAATTNQSGIYVNVPSVTVRGLSLYNFDYDCISVADLADSSIVEGNYLGASGDGETAPGNGGMGIYLGQSGTNGNNSIVSNLISGVTGYGISLNGVNNSSIEDNVILNGGDSGITFNFSVPSDVVTVKGNIVSNNDGGGIFVSSGNTPAIISVYSNTVFNNGPSGISVAASSGVRIGAPGLGNIVYGHSQANIGVTSLTGFFGSASNVTIQSNSIGLPDSNTSGMGVAVMGDASDILIGGDAPSEANTISRVELAGVAVSTFTVDAFDVSFHPNTVSVLGNSISGTTESLGSYPAFTAGLGIDLLTQIDTDQSPDGTPNVLADEGATLNDPLDPDTGANNYINFPVLNSITESTDGTQATINYSLDAADSPTNQYRIEFFGNDEADPSGYGEGQTFLGAITSENGNNQQTILTLPNDYNLRGKAISATATAIDGSTPSGYASTSEFSRSVLVPGANDALAESGSNKLNMVLIGMFMSALPLILVARRSKRNNIHYRHG